MGKRPDLTSQPSSDEVREGPAYFGVLEEEGLVGYATLGQGGRAVAEPVLSEARRQQMHNPIRDDFQADEDATERTSLLKQHGRSAHSKKPWYRRASPWYIHFHMLGFALGMGLMAAPRIELYTQAICSQINGDISMHHSPQDDLPMLLLTPDQCRHSTSVQRRLAELNLAISVVMGTLCVLTTPFWGALSDRIGRKPVIAANVMSFFLGVSVLVAVLSNTDRIPYQWVVLSAAVEGIFAGMGGGQSIMSAYIGDCTDPGSRAGTFSLMMGILFGGIAAGPAISSFLIQTTGNLLVPFYGSLGIHALQALFTIFVLPESLSEDKQSEAKQARKMKQAEDEEKDREEAQRLEQDGGGIGSKVLLRAKNGLRPVTGIFAPLALLGPREKAGGGLDWSLPMVALGSGLYSMVMAVYTIKMQYAQLKFNWTAVELGNLLSLMGVTRIIALLVVIPLLCKLVRKPHLEPIRDSPPSPSESEETLTETPLAGTSGFSKAHDEEWDKHKAQHRAIHDYKFDLLLARISILFDVGCYTALIFTQTATYFCIFVVAQSLGSGANPALSSLALMFADPQKTGQLMAAMTVFQILMAQIIAPIMFNEVFAYTVDWFPEAFFVLGAVIFFLTFLTLAFVRVRRPKLDGSAFTNASEIATSEITTSTA